MRPGAEITSIDANVIVRFLTGDDPKLYAKAYEMFGDIDSGKATVVCDPVNLAEVVWVLRSFYRLSHERVLELLQPIVEMDRFLVPDKERYLLALKLYAEGVKSFGDACACAAAIQDCDGRLYSFDTKLSKVAGITRSERVP